MNIETAMVIFILLLVLALAYAVLYLRARVCSLEKGLESERDYRREVQSHSYEVRNQLHQGFSELGLKWSPKKDAGWSK